MSKLPLLELHSEHARFPLHCRPASSDMCVFRQIFIEREYACLDDVRGAGLIIDCGANVGYSSAYFLTHFPGSEVIAIEPDPDNYAVLERNLEPYNGVTLRQSAVWSHQTRLTLSEHMHGDGREWSRQVRECRSESEMGFVSVDIKSLLEGAGFRRIFILKVDIEGAEAVVFADCSSWIDRVDNIVIELHEDSCFGEVSEIFSRAVSGRGFHVTRHGDLTVCKRG